MAKKISPYYSDFITMVEYSCQAAELLLDAIVNFDPSALPERRTKMHVIEKNEDQMRHVLLERLVKEFVPPIDREDIIQMANVLDNVTDKIEDILIHLDIFNIQEMHPAALDFANAIVRCCESLLEAMTEFPNFRKSTTLRPAIININSIEEECDEIYINSMRELYRNTKDRMEIFLWGNIFEIMEDCCDACEHVAEVMDIIIMKNS